MIKENLKNKTTEQLKSDLKLIQTVTITLIFVLSLLLVFSVYGLFAQDNNSTFIALIAVAISCGAILPLQFSSIKELKSELKLKKKNS